MQLLHCSSSVWAQSISNSAHVHLLLTHTLCILLMGILPGSTAVAALLDLPRCNPAAFNSAELELEPAASQGDTGDPNVAEGCTAAECILRASFSALLAAGRMEVLGEGLCTIRVLLRWLVKHLVWYIQVTALKDRQPLSGTNAILYRLRPL